MADPIFQKNLQDLIKGIRANKKDAAAYISQSIQDIKIELKTTDPFLKAEAVCCLLFFIFNIINVISRTQTPENPCRNIGKEIDVFANARIQCQLGIICYCGSHVSTEVCT